MWHEKKVTIILKYFFSQKHKSSSILIKISTDVQSLTRDQPLGHLPYNFKTENTHSTIQTSISLKHSTNHNTNISCNQFPLLVNRSYLKPTWRMTSLNWGMLFKFDNGHYNSKEWVVRRTNTKNGKI